MRCDDVEFVDDFVSGLSIDCGVAVGDDCDAG